ncbi:phosphatidylinositol mannoside acyltransferase [Nocardiopsis dassonvillei]|uniref:Lipid A biosynthesis acyltransferase n=1 Tax=Nocardiopsis dassonvillei (strain ATCC 23218 / DSM 43111 / CIP 107115 / JCM 7437 / KCTC 9190 / NBRC 14626 / NCTC 10488 / NRRL B-5397 / IMRU 509) TaxID=446468 RepID=D7AZH2_NOCDD|nr:lipid A biosynthesis acyltransferase [Nocardiopsis dassonvillei subsp. dassonvillei DSM 43111]NKY81755.1 phosphatidylinositol mannoside acyltransferase [Nocardiopsis dassonvillei]VEI92286.1 Phosphatidylinositol mannoside acyltransferase [Nocardiopsis dassonvillei]
MDERTADLAYTAGWAMIRRTPESAGRALFRRLADRSWRAHDESTRGLERNLRRLVGPGATDAQLRALSRAGMRSYMRYYYEMFRLPAMGEEYVLGRTRATGIEVLEEHVRSGRGVVAALPHMGNWDHAGAWIALRGTPLTTVAQRLRPESLFQRFTAYRESLGMEVLPLTGGSNTVGTLARRLRGGGLVCLLADRDISGTGLEVDFFGERARVPAGPAALALNTGAALMPVSLWYDGPYWNIRVHDEIPVSGGATRAERVQATTQELVRVFEGAIAEHPEDWHMLQPVFSADHARVSRGRGADGGVPAPVAADRARVPRGATAETAVPAVTDESTASGGAGDGTAPGGAVREDPVGGTVPDEGAPGGAGDATAPGTRGGFTAANGVGAPQGSGARPPGRDERNG